MRDLPPGMDVARLAAELTAGWALEVRELQYLPLGFGSYHWRVDGTHFATVDVDRPALRRALDVAVALALPFVVAPIPDRTGATVRPVDDRYGVALYPLLDGEAGSFGPHPAPDLPGVAAMLSALHAAGDPGADADDLELTGRPELVDALGDLAQPWTCGPYAERTRRLLASRARRIERALGKLDRLAAGIGDDRVITHGEPHPGNVLRVRDGLRLIDWDTVRLAPPERDLWLLGAGRADYARLTGRKADPNALAFYRLRWELADVANFVAELRAPHAQTADAAARWRYLNATLGELGGVDWERPDGEPPAA